MSNHSRGFTLLEIMIAVAVFAVASAALIKNAAITVRQTSDIRDKTLAYWIAENEVAEMKVTPRTDQTFPNVGTDRASVTMANREWEVMTRVENTENQDMRRVTVSVYREEDLDNAVVNLTSFVGKY